MSRPAPLGVALIGCGNIGAAAHTPAYLSVPGVDLVAVCDPVKARVQAVSETTGAPIATFEQILDDPAVMAVDVAVPTPVHAEVVEAALRAGKHVLIEKPIAVEVADGRRLVDLASRSGLVLMVGHVRRHDPRFRAVAAEVAAGSIGVPRYLRRAERQWLPFPAESWFWSGPGGGTLIDVGIHVVDLVRWLMGEPASVYATALRIRPEARLGSRPDHVFVTFGFEDGATAVGEASWAHPPSFATFYGALEVVGTEGVISLRDEESPLVISGPDGVEHPRLGPFLSTVPAAFSAQLAHFAAVVAGEEGQHQSASDAVASLALCLAAAESAETGRPVDREGRW